MMQIKDQQLLQTGLSSVFHGTFQMLKALDPDFAEKALSRISTFETEKTLKRVQKSEKSEASASENKNVVEETVAEKSVAEKSVTEKPSSTVSKDDLTKIIVQKIKKDRSNNQKIGEILKNYGAAKVSELHVSKYEEFLTELSAL